MTHVVSKAIASVEDVKSALEITDGSADDQLLAITEAIGEAVEQYLGRPVIARDVTESVDGNGTSSLLLKPYLISVTTVEIDDVAITAATQRVFYPDTGKVQLRYHTFTLGFQNIDLVYRHGWELDDIPPAIKMAATNWCIRQWMMTSKDRVGVVSKSTPEGSSITYESAEVPGNIFAL